MKQKKCDLLILGTGIAGLTAALKADKGLDVLICTKGTVTETNTGLAQGGIAAVMDDQDKPQYHYQDTINVGVGLCEPEAVKVLVHDGPVLVRELIAMGAQFDMGFDGYSLAQEAAHSRRRILHAGDTTGHEIEKTLGNQVRTKKNIEIIEKLFIKDVVIKNNRCVGAIGISIGTGEPWLIQSRATIIATGGLGQVYLKNTNPYLATGDGVAMAARAGCTISDMEFVQFHPTTLVTGDRKPISIFLISEAVRGEGAQLLNSAGHRFMPDYHPLAELAPRDVVARAIFLEKKKSGTPNVFLDFSHIKIDIKKRFPEIYKRCLEQGYDITRELIPVAPAAHYAMGGIKTDVDGRTGISGLYAAGEVSAVGVHGANRLASNSLLDGLVFGARAAIACNEYVRGKKHLEIALPRVKAAHVASEELEEARVILKTIMWENVSIVRNELGLNQAMKSIEHMLAHLPAASMDYRVCELQNMLLVSRMIVQMALTRIESRGAHYRDDYPDTLRKWQHRQEIRI